MFFYLKNIQVHVFCSDFSQVSMFSDDYRSKLAPESTQYGGFLSLSIADNLHKKSKIEDLITEGKVGLFILQVN